MAKKRRSKHRSGARQKNHQSQTAAAMCSDGQYPQSSRQSSDGTLSEHATASDSALTAMTSLASTDDESTTRRPRTDIPDLNPEIEYIDDDEDDDDRETVSIHPASRYPRVPSPHMSEMPYSTEYLGHGGGHSDVAASTRSLWEQDLDYREIHGRRYCRDYFMPNDEMEQLRLALQHQVFLHVLDGELTTVQLDKPTHILDVGTGTGEWAIRLAELYPRCEVVGTDIAAIAETSSVPMNVFFEIEDAEDWDRMPDCYDLIHLRSMEGAFRDWTFIYDNAFYSLKPGGWIEVQDFDTAEGMDKFREHLPPDSPLHSLMEDLDQAAIKAGRKRGTTHMDPRVLMDSGFVDVRVTEYVVPISVAEKTAGKFWLISCLDSLESNCLRWLTEHMEWDPDTCKEACENAAREMAQIAKHPEKSKGLIVKVRIVVARKPLDAPKASAPPYFRDSRSCSATPSPREDAPDPMQLEDP
ncbi:S-adenosyl-L-methionine-dependent methyltransferase [Stachybotrys elegans]|uniref:S-adenosyl-L-methionine-dependent methyltransferase n=1 Tax=Stachybotrys elegans TaxID=80388 RepID=A0A8K0SP40_9HYPO|nr:S-adenosyl-L-methionine-dependent methyltransferase [Stachybotrys elegans]